MQQYGIRARGKRRFRVTTTDSRHELPVAPNLLNRNVPDLIEGVYGTRRWMAQLGSKGGSANTGAKRRASRANGNSWSDGEFVVRRD
jgi:hypothetical protein